MNIFLKKNKTFIAIIIAAFIIGGFIYLSNSRISFPSPESPKEEIPNLKTKKQVVPKDELQLFTQLQQILNETMEAERISDNRIYLPRFPHYQKEFVEFEESIANLPLLEQVKRKELYAKENPEYQAYRNAVTKQLDKVFQWGYQISRGKTLAMTLHQIMEGEKQPSEIQELLERYAKASVKFWNLEEIYYYYSFCYRTQQQMEISDCLNNQEKRLGKFPDDLEQQRNSALLTVIILGKKIDALVE